MGSPTLFLHHAVHFFHKFFGCCAPDTGKQNHTHSHTHTHLQTHMTQNEAVCVCVCECVMVCENPHPKLDLRHLHFIKRFLHLGDRLVAQTWPKPTILYRRDGSISYAYIHICKAYMHIYYIYLCTYTYVYNMSQWASKKLQGETISFYSFFAESVLLAKLSPCHLNLFVSFWPEGFHLNQVCVRLLLPKLNQQISTAFLGTLGFCFWSVFLFFYFRFAYAASGRFGTQFAC